MKTSVMVTTAGTIVAQGIIKSLKFANSVQNPPVSYRIITADLSAEAAGIYRSDAGYLVPPISTSDYVTSILKICKAEQVRAVFVGADEELLKLAEAKERIEEETEAVVLTNPAEVISVCTDKWKTFEFLKANNLSCPDSSLPDEREGFIREHGFPLVVKPREGHGSLEVYVAKNPEDVDHAISMIESAGWHPIIQQFISNDDLEFTMGVTVDRQGKHVMSSIAMRRKLKGGQTYKAFIDDFKDVRRTSEDTALKLGARGPVNIQGRVSGNELKIFEINPRFSASCPLRAFAGVNEPDIVFRNVALNEDIRITNYQKVVCLRYWNEVYVPSSTFERVIDEKRIVNADSVIPNYF